MRILETKIYTINELSDEAKQKARDWYRQGAFDFDWYSSVYDDFEQIAVILGLTIGNHNGREKHIYFSGFSSQGDGASFSGSFEYKKGMSKAIREYAPQDTELHRIADTLSSIQAPFFYRLRGTVKQSGSYVHKYTMTTETEDGSGNSVSAEIEDTITEVWRDLAEWIYRTLEKEYEYLNEDAQVDEAITANEYEFTETGKRA